MIIISTAIDLDTFKISGKVSHHIQFTCLGAKTYDFLWWIGAMAAPRRARVRVRLERSKSIFYRLSGLSMHETGGRLFCMLTFIFLHILGGYNTGNSSIRDQIFSHWHTLCKRMSANFTLVSLNTHSVPSVELQFALISRFPEHIRCTARDKRSFYCAFLTYIWCAVEIIPTLIKRDANSLRSQCSFVLDWSETRPCVFSLQLGSPTTVATFSDDRRPRRRQPSPQCPPKKKKKKKNPRRPTDPLLWGVC